LTSALLATLTPHHIKRLRNKATQFQRLKEQSSDACDRSETEANALSYRLAARRNCCTWRTTGGDKSNEKGE
jgi:hypothetical protein